MFSMASGVCVYVRVCVGGCGCLCVSCVPVVWQAASRSMCVRHLCNFILCGFYTGY